MRVQDIMTSPVETITAETPAEDAWRVMRQKGIRHLLVKEGRELSGVFSERDAGGPRGTATRRGSVVGALMSRGVVTVPPTTTVRRAANMMRGRSIGSLVVLDGRQAVGIVTVSDLLELVSRDQSVLKQRPALSHRAPHRKRHTSTGPW